jgi:16S rRNA (guanine527-N7)-methyltransferase
MLERYGQLVERYHSTLDLLSPVALRNWQLLLDEALSYAALLGELAPQAATILDLGSGAGLPGIPVAISTPGAQVHLVERRRRRTAFLNLAVGSLGLTNVTVHGSDVRELAGLKAQVITAQAVAGFSEVYALTRGLHAGQLWLLSRKGPDWRSELAELEEQTGRAVIKVVERPLSTRGTLVAVFLAGGLACQPSE